MFAYGILRLSCLYGGIRLRSCCKTLSEVS
jgi:hypothetical protein